MTLRILYFSLIALLIINVSYAGSSGEHHSEGDEHNKNRFGQEKAITDVDEQNGFKLSPESIKTMGIETRVIDVKGPQIPKSSFVSVKNKKGFYILRDGYFSFVELNSIRDLMPNDRVVTKGMGIIAITDVFSTDEAEYSH